jgi:hypothetical protein
MITAAALAIGAVACGDDNGDGGTPPQATAPVAQPSAGPPGIVDGNTFISTARNYKIDFPEGWKPDENFLFTANFAIDAFIAPAEVSGVEPSINVRCDFNADNAITHEDFVAARRSVAEGFSYQDVQEAPVTLGGEQAVQFTYEQLAGDKKVKKVEVAYAGHGCAWTVTLTNAADDDNYADAFAASLASFSFIASPGGS